MNQRQGRNRGVVGKGSGITVEGGAKASAMMQRADNMFPANLSDQGYVSRLL